MTPRYQKRCTKSTSGTLESSDSAQKWLIEVSPRLKNSLKTHKSLKLTPYGLNSIVETVNRPFHAQHQLAKAQKLTPRAKIYPPEAQPQSLEA